MERKYSAAFAKPLGSDEEMLEDARRTTLNAVSCRIEAAEVAGRRPPAP